MTSEKVESQNRHKDQVSAIISMLPSKQHLHSNLGLSQSRTTIARQRRNTNKVHPENQLDEELGEYGIKQRVVEDEEEQFKALLTIKSLPCSMTTKRKIKNKLFEKPVKPIKGCDAWKYRRKQGWRKFKMDMKEVGYKLELWRSWFKRIEGHQGTGVLSYFVFLKWMLFLNFYLFLILIGFVVIPYKVLNANGYTSQVTGSSVSGVSTTNAATCSALYVVNTSSDAASLIQDFIQGTGWMENTALFYGYYDAQDRLFGSTDHHYLFPFAYFMAVLGVLFFSLVRMARFTIRSFKENLNDDHNSNKTDYCNKVFGGWDFALEEDDVCITKQKSIYKDLAANLEHQKYMLTRMDRSGVQKCKTYTIRFFINILILAILGGSGYLIYYVTDWSTQYLQGQSSSSSLTVLLVEFLPSLTITLLNVIVPLIFKILVNAEDYTDEFVIQITLIRTVFLRLASLAVLMLSLYVQISCSSKDATCNVNTGSCTEIRCWESYVGQTFYKLVVLDFLVHILVIFAYELMRKVLTTKCSCSICAKIGPAEFDVAKSVLDLVYTQALCWIGFLYCPLIPALTVVSTFTQFYLKLFSALFTTVPPEKPYKASRSNSFFMIVLMATFFLCCIPVGYSMVKIRPSTGCGPFRIYTDMSICVDTTIDNLPDWLKAVVEICTSTAMIVSILTVLCLVIYYLYVRGKAHSARADVMKEQLVMEGKDKQFLLAKIYELTGTGERPKPKPKAKELPPPKVTTENEDYSKDFAVKARSFVKDDVPPPPAYEDEMIPMKEHNRLPPMNVTSVPEDDWSEEPIVVAVTSPQDHNSPIPTRKTPSPAPVRSRNVKKSKVSPSQPDTGPPSNMPFDF